MREKKYALKKNGAQLIFSSHILDHFWRTVSGGGFSCSAERAFGPLQRVENATFGPF